MEEERKLVIRQAHTFGVCLDTVRGAFEKSGKQLRFRRFGWAEGMYIVLDKDEGGELVFVTWHERSDHAVWYTPNLSDIFAKDWFIDWEHERNAKG